MLRILKVLLQLWNWSRELTSWCLHWAKSFTQEIKIALTLRRRDQDVLRSIMLIHKPCKTHALVLKSAATEDHHKDLTHEWRQNLQPYKISSSSHKLCHLPMPRARCLGRSPDVAQHYGRSRWEIFQKWSIRGDAIWVIYWSSCKSISASEGRPKWSTEWRVISCRASCNVKTLYETAQYDIGDLNALQAIDVREWRSSGRSMLLLAESEARIGAWWSSGDVI